MDHPQKQGLQCIVDCYGTYIVHLTAMIEDTMIRAGDCNHLKGYIRTWKELKILVVCAMYMEALNPVSLLSLML